MNNRKGFKFKGKDQTVQETSGDQWRPVEPTIKFKIFALDDILNIDR